MVDPLTHKYFQEQFEAVLLAVKGGFDHVDEELTGLKTDVAGLKTDVATLKIDVADLKRRMKSVEDEVLTLSANMVTKQYLDAKIDQLIDAQRKDSLFKRKLLLALEEAKVLTPETRAKLEHLIPAISLSE